MHDLSKVRELTSLKPVKLQASSTFNFQCDSIAQDVLFITLVACASAYVSYITSFTSMLHYSLAC
eukprot:352445-Amphidinium_carterae.2